MTWKAHVEEHRMTGERRLYVWRRKFPGPGAECISGLAASDVPEGGSFADAPAMISDSRESIEDNAQMLQAIFDACWDFGMRPRGHDALSGDYWRHVAMPPPNVRCIPAPAGYRK